MQIRLARADYPDNPPPGLRFVDRLWAGDLLP
jgi:hypothetical protein